MRGQEGPVIRGSHTQLAASTRQQALSDAESDSLGRAGKTIATIEQQSRGSS
jgi:hypothetical protein